MGTLSPEVFTRSGGAIEWRKSIRTNLGRQTAMIPLLPDSPVDKRHSRRRIVR